MNICVWSSQNTVQDCEDVGTAVYVKYPRVFSTIAQVFLHDPFLLSAFGKDFKIWEMKEETDRARLADVDLLIIPHAISTADELQVISYFNAGGKTLWVRPSESALRQITNGSASIVRTLKSHRERWELPGGTFYYPQMLTYDQYSSGTGEGFWAIGDSPGVVRLGQATICPGDIFFAHMWYMNSPLDTLSPRGELSSFQTMFSTEILHLLSREADEKTLFTRFFLRRDFHAYGFARRKVKDLLELHERSTDLSSADALVHSAATKLAAGEQDSCVEEELRNAFIRLKEARDEVTAIPIYYADGMHGGILTEDYGYIEIASPQFVADLFRMFLELGRRRGYRFSCDISIATFVHLEKRFPTLIQELRDAMEEGFFEAANGSIGQLYPHLFSLEINIRQFVSGQTAMERLFGRKARSFLAQEFQLTPSYASILAQSGYDLALHRIQNKGATVYSDQTSIIWQSPDGESIRTIPTHFDDSQQAISTGFTHWPELITKTAKSYPMGIYTNLLDIVWITMFREEAIRSSWYAPVLGKFVTYRDLAGMIEPAEVVTYVRDDYLPEMQPGTSRMLSEMWDLGRRLESLEKYLALQRDNRYDKQLADAWNALGEYVNHDNTVCFHVRPKDQTYLPFSAGPDRSGPELYDVLQNTVQTKVSAIADSLGNARRLFNPMNLPKDEIFVGSNGQWASVKHASEITASTEVAFCTVPALSTVAYPPGLSRQGCADSPDLRIDTGHFSVSLNKTNGSISSIKYHRQELLAGDANLISAGLEGDSRLISWRRDQYEGIQFITCDLSLAYPDGRPGGKARTCMAFPSQRPIIYFTTKVFPALHIREPYRTYDYDRSGAIGVQFCLDPAYDDHRDCWIHHIHEKSDGKKREYGPGLYYGNRSLERQYLENRKGHITQSAMGLVLYGSDSPSLLLHNDGSTIYEIDGGTVRNLLWCSYEYGDQFSYALEVIGDSDPFRAMLSYQYDLLPVPDDTPAGVPLVTGGWLSAMFAKDNELYLRVVETEGMRSLATIVPHIPAVEVWLTNTLGEKTRQVQNHERIEIPLEPHGFVTVCLQC